MLNPYSTIFGADSVNSILRARKTVGAKAWV
jgi:hypothetical protein